jgi:hypothetical protein
MRPFIREINQIVEKQPPLDLVNWTDRIFLNDKPELAIYNTHNGLPDSVPPKGQLPSYLKIANTDPGKPVALTPEDVVKLSEWAGKRISDFTSGDLEEKGIYLCGGVTIDLPREAALRTPRQIAR